MLDPDKRRTILMVDDDAEDYHLVLDALNESGNGHKLRFVRNGEEMFDYLRHQGDYGEPLNAPLPDLILLDLKMPCMDGREALQEIKADPQLRRIPVIVLTTSTAEDDVAFAYDMGVNSFITKPATFRQWANVIDTLTKYWFEIVELPPAPEKGVEQFITGEN